MGSLRGQGTQGQGDGTPDSTAHPHHHLEEDVWAHGASFCRLANSESDSFNQLLIQVWVHRPPAEKSGAPYLLLGARQHAGQ